MASCTSTVKYTRPSSQSKSTAKTRKVTNSASSKKAVNVATTEEELDFGACLVDEEEAKSAATQVNIKAAPSDLKKVVDKYLGIRYKYGGESRRGMDCSGLVYRVFQDLGHREFIRTSSGVLANMGHAVSRKKLKAGDLVFFKKGARINHVGIYMGQGVFAHASSSKGVMYAKMNSDYFRHRYARSRRIY